MNGNGFNGRKKLYGEYQKRLFLECLEDAKEISERYPEVNAFHLALIFFRKRCKSLYHYRKDGGGSNSGQSGRDGRDREDEKVWSRGIAS